MAMDFPNSPTVGQQYSVSGGPTYTWSGTAWRVLTPGNQFNRTTFTATAGQTVFSVTYTVGAVDVFQNGVKLVSGSDFTATNGTSITLTNAATVGDTIEVIAYSQVVYATAAKAEDVYSVVRGMKNRIINGDARIDQRKAGVAQTGVTTAATYIADRFFYLAASGPTVTVQQSSTAPAGFTNSLYCTVTSTGSPSFGLIHQSIEGYNVADLMMGTSSAQAFTVSFWVRSSQTGIYSVSIQSSTFDYSYNATYTINAANTWQYVSVTIPGTANGTWYYDNRAGLHVRFCLCPNASAANSWVSGSFNGATTNVNWFANSGATFYITGVQLEVGAVVNPVYERRPYALELQLCQRYFQQIGAGATGFEESTTRHSYGIKFPVPMRASPTFLFNNGTSTMTVTTRYIGSGGTGDRSYSASIDANSTITATGAWFYLIDNTSGGLAGRGSIERYGVNWINASAEL